MSKVVCITGMHRSGTSLTASWLQQSGLQIDDGALIDAAIGNPHGHFEDKDFVDLHTAVLLEANAASCGWIVDKPLQNVDKKALERRANALLNARSQYNTWGWKDPRTVLFLNTWKALVPDLSTIFVWRPASQVVDSLVRRSEKATHPYFKITKAQAYRVWAYYNKQAIAYHEQNPALSVVVGIDQITNHSQKLINHLNNKLTLELNIVDINSLVDSSLMKNKPKDLADSFYYLKNGIGPIENKLRALSVDLS